MTLHHQPNSTQDQESCWGKNYIRLSNPELSDKISQNQEAFIQMINDSDEELNVDITIRNLKEEAKDDDMESGVSDGE